MTKRDWRERHESSIFLERHPGIAIHVAVTLQGYMVELVSVLTC